MMKPTKHAGRRLDPPNDRAFILDPGRWPTWPFLPMKRRDTHRSGIIVGDPSPCGKVWFCPDMNVWMLNTADTEIKAKGSLRPVDDVLAEGWVID